MKCQSGFCTGFDEVHPFTNAKGTILCRLCAFDDDTAIQRETDENSLEYICVDLGVEYDAEEETITAGFGSRSITMHVGRRRDDQRNYHMIAPYNTRSVTRMIMLAVHEHAFSDGMTAARARIRQELGLIV